jgi:hypothetical protein
LRKIYADALFQRAFFLLEGVRVRPDAYIFGTSVPPNEEKEDYLLELPPQNN